MPEKIVHRLAEIIRFRMLMIVAGYEDGNDADTLRRDPMYGENNLCIAHELDPFRDDTADNHQPSRRNQCNGVLIVNQTGHEQLSVAVAAGRVTETMNKIEPMITDQPAKNPSAGPKTLATQA